MGTYLQPCQLVELKVYEHNIPWIVEKCCCCSYILGGQSPVDPTLKFQGSSKIPRWSQLPLVEKKWHARQCRCVKAVHTLHCS